MIATIMYIANADIEVEECKEIFNIDYFNNPKCFYDMYYYDVQSPNYRNSPVITFDDHFDTFVKLKEKYGYKTELSEKANQIVFDFFKKFDQKDYLR